MRASSLPVETHCEDGGWIQPGLNLFSFSDACNKDFSQLIESALSHALVQPYRSRTISIDTRMPSIITDRP